MLKCTLKFGLSFAYVHFQPLPFNQKNHTSVYTCKDCQMPLW